MNSHHEQNFKDYFLFINQTFFAPKRETCQNSDAVRLNTFPDFSIHWCQPGTDPTQAKDQMTQQCSSNISPTMQECSCIIWKWFEGTSQRQNYFFTNCWEQDAPIAWCGMIEKELCGLHLTCRWIMSALFLYKWTHSFSVELKTRIVTKVCRHSDVRPEILTVLCDYESTSESVASVPLFGSETKSTAWWKAFTLSPQVKIYHFCNTIAFPIV